MIVMKFGGSSVADSQKIVRVANLIKDHFSEKPVVVLSAMGDVTDWLLETAANAEKGSADILKIEEMHKKTMAELGITVSDFENLLEELKKLLTGIQMIQELTKRTRDYLVSFGERFSVRILAAYLCKIGVASKAVDSWDAGFLSDSNYGNAEILSSSWQKIENYFLPYKNGKSCEIPIVTGFIAKDSQNRITTLGRGGSDLTATMIGSACGANEIQTWKDVDGIMSADPTICKNAKSVPEVTYEEAQELALFGAQVLHPRSMIPCQKTGTIVRVKNSYNPKSEGTKIVEKHEKNFPSIVSITSVSGVSIIDIVSTRMLGASGFLAHIFNVFLKHEVSIDVIATSEISVSLTVSDSVDLTDLLLDLKNVAQVEVKTKKAIVAIICDVAHSSKILAKTFLALEKNSINVQMISQGASKVNISFLVSENERATTVRLLHEALFENADS